MSEIDVAKIKKVFSFLNWIYHNCLYVTLIQFKLKVEKQLISQKNIIKWYSSQDTLQAMYFIPYK